MPEVNVYVIKYVSNTWEVWEGGDVQRVKVPATKPDNPSAIPKTHTLWGLGTDSSRFSWPL